MNSSDEPIAPRADHRVIDSEAVNKEAENAEARNKAYKNRSEKQSDKPLEAKIEKKTPFFTHIKRFMIGTIVIAVIAAFYWLYGNKQSDWEVEKINQLQAEVGQLKTDVQELKSSQTDLSAQVTKLPQSEGLSEENKERLVQVDSIQTKLKEMESYLMTLTPDKEASSQDNASFDSPEPSQVETQTVVGQQNKNEENADFSQLESQLVLLQQQVKDLNTQLLSQKETASPSQVKPASGSLSAMRIQQWILQINTQWILTGNPEKTKNNLLALEQAVGISQFEHKNRLLRLIGEDLNSLSESAETTKPTETIDTLRKWIVDMPWLDMKPIEVPRETETAINQDGDQTRQDSLSVWQRIQDKFGALFIVKKRDVDAQLTQAERLAQQDVLKERALLLLDRVDWALMMESPDLLEKTRNEFEAYMKQNFPEQQSEFEILFASVKAYEFSPQKVLKIVEGM